MLLVKVPLLGIPRTAAFLGSLGVMMDELIWACFLVSSHWTPSFYLFILFFLFGGGGARGAAQNQKSHNFRFVMLSYVKDISGKVNH